MLKIPVAVLVSGGGTNLQALIDSEIAGNMPSCHIECVISSRPGVAALTRAEKAKIPNYVYSTEEELLSLLTKHEVKLVVLAGFFKILSKDFINSFSGPIINVHPSLIPSFCGKGYYGIKIHEMALSYGVKVTGATVLFVNEIPDGGEIIFQKPVYVKSGDTPEILQRRVMEEAEWVLLPRAVEQVSSKLLEATDYE